MCFICLMCLNMFYKLLSYCYYNNNASYSNHTLAIYFRLALYYHNLLLENLILVNMNMMILKLRSFSTHPKIIFTYTQPNGRECYDVRIVYLYNNEMCEVYYCTRNIFFQNKKHAFPDGRITKLNQFLLFIILTSETYLVYL